MSHGALSAEAHETIAIALNRLGGKANSGEGGEDPARFRDERNCTIKQVASGRFGVTPEYAAFAEELQIKIAQGSKPGEGGQLPGHKVSSEIARLRHTTPGVALISPPPHHDIYSIEDLAQLIFDLKPGEPRGGGLGEARVRERRRPRRGRVVKALADVVHIAGATAAPARARSRRSRTPALAWELGLAETQQALVANGLRGRVRVRVDGGFKTGRDVVVAALLGADEMSFGTALLLAEGCMMVRTCHVDSCPVGIATQNPELRAKFAATPEQVMAYLVFVAEEVRRLLASLGLRSLEEAVGRVELLRPVETGDARADSLDLAPLGGTAGDGPTRFVGDAHVEPRGWELGARLAEEAAPILDESRLVELQYEIATRTAPSVLGWRRGRRPLRRRPAPGRVRATFNGVAGQGFGAFLAAGVELGSSARPTTTSARGWAAAASSSALPGTTRAAPSSWGTRCSTAPRAASSSAPARRASASASATPVPSPSSRATGDHPCEYMTSGTVVILGPYGLNLGAGMTGGEVFVYDPEERMERHLNAQLVLAQRLDSAEAERLRALLARHVRLTGSERAEAMLGDWDVTLGRFWRVAPRAEVARIESAAEGTVAGKAAS